MKVMGGGTDYRKTNAHLMAEAARLGARVAELERIAAKHDLLEVALRESEMRYRSLFDEVPVALYRTTASGRFLEANPAMVRMTGYASCEELLSVNAFELYVNPGDRTRWQALMEEKEIVADFEFRVRRRDGSAIWVRNSARAFKDENGKVTCFEGSLEDITLRKMAHDALERANEELRARLDEIASLQEQLRERAIRDHLTNLFNRRYLEETLTHELAKAERKSYPVSLLMVDIDHFKSINDSYGHNAGDEALQALAVFIQSRIRRSDIACRFGGDEFVIVLPEASLGMACDRAESLRRDVQDSCKVNNGNIGPLAVSIGVAAYPLHGTSGEELLRAVDQALYAAKSGGRNRVVVALTPAGI